jgi:hypothetical protein
MLTEARPAESRAEKLVHEFSAQRGIFAILAGYIR